MRSFFPYSCKTVSVAVEYRFDCQQQIVSGIQHAKNTTIDVQKKVFTPGIANVGSNGSGMKYEYLSIQNTTKEANMGNKKKKLRTTLNPTLLSRRLNLAATPAFSKSGVFREWNVKKRLFELIV